MSEVYTPTALFPASVTLPEDGEPKPFGTTRVGIAAALDRSEYLKDRLLSPQIPIPLKVINIYDANDRFIFSSLANVGGGWLQTDVTDAGVLLFEMSPSLGAKCTIAYIQAVVACAAHAADPIAGGATLPKLSLLSEDTSQKTTMIVNAYESDQSETQAEYEERHVITLDCATLFGGDGLEWDVNGDFLYYLKFEGETNGGGANAEANKLLLKALYVTPVNP